MQRSRAGIAQERERSCADQRRQNRRRANAPISNGAGILYSRFDSALGFFAPLSVDRLKTFRFAYDLRSFHPRRRQFFIREIASARAEISAGIAQNIDQLQSHAVALAQIEHFIFAPRREVPHMPKAETRPKLTGRSGDEVSVFIEISRRLQCNDSISAAKLFE